MEINGLTQNATALEKELGATGTAIRGFQGDAADAASVDETVTAVTSEWGSVTSWLTMPALHATT